MLLGTLGVSLLRNMLSGKGIVRAGNGNKERKGVLRANYRKRKKILRHPLIKIEIKWHYQNEPRYNGVYSRIIFLKNKGWG